MMMAFLGKLIVAAGFVGIFSACEEETTPGEVAPPPVPPYEASFILSKMKIGTKDQGFNLDGIHSRKGENPSPDCADGVCHEDGANGVDNRLSEILKSIDEATAEEVNADESIAKNIEEGDLLLLFRLLDVEVAQMASAAASDPDVEAMGYVGVDTDDPPNPSDNLSGSEPFDVDSRSLADTNDINKPFVHFKSCSLEKGRFACQPSLFRLELSIGETPLQLELHQAQLQAEVTKSPQKDENGNYVGGAMGAGILGGYVPIKNLQEALHQITEDFGDINPATIEQIMLNHADIDAIQEGMTDEACSGDDDCASWQDCRNGFCYEPADTYDAISLGVTFELKSAVFTGKIVPPS